MFMEYINIYHTEEVETNHIFIKISGKRQYKAMEYTDVDNLFRTLRNKTNIYVTAHMFRHTLYFSIFLYYTIVYMIFKEVF